MHKQKIIILQNRIGIKLMMFEITKRNFKNRPVLNFLINSKKSFLE